MTPIGMYYAITFIGIVIASILSLIIINILNIHTTSFWDIFTAWLLMAILFLILERRKHEP